VLRRRKREEANAPTAWPEPAAAVERPEPPAGARHLVVVVLDSLRYDSWLRAEPKLPSRLGPVERRWSYASWTAPSHYNLLMGLLPHASPTHVYASEYYKADLQRYTERLGVPGIEFKELLPSLFLPSYLRNRLGYQTSAMVSMPVLNQHTPLNRDFDSYTLMPTHNDMAAMLARLSFPDDRPSFHLLNVGETHYPYALAGEDPSEWPRLSGVHGAVRQLGERVDEQRTAFFDMDQMETLRDRQVRALTGLEPGFEQLFDVVPPSTWIILTSDHGELFGEGGYFGHGPIAHDKVFEVPFVEGQVR